MNELALYLRERNAKTEAWVAEDPDNRWAGTYTEDLAHWAEAGIFTVAQFKRNENETLFWEMYKDATGVSPRGIDFKSMSDEELEKEIDSLGRMIERQIEEDKEMEYLSMVYAQEDAEEENKIRDEQPEEIDYVAANYQDGWI